MLAFASEPLTAPARSLGLVTVAAGNQLALAVLGVEPAVVGGQPLSAVEWP
ncbi:MAG: hypothetical protein ACJ73S_09385 [Mycobacteriales bacterium]